MSRGISKAGLLHWLSGGDGEHSNTLKYLFWLTDDGKADGPRKVWSLRLISEEMKREPNAAWTEIFAQKTFAILS